LLAPTRSSLATSRCVPVGATGCRRPTDAALCRAWTRCARLRLRRRWTSSCLASPAAPEGSRCARPACAYFAPMLTRTRTSPGLLGHRLPGHAQLPGGWTRAGRQALRPALRHLRAEAAADVPEGEAQV
jgi:hypothetical protein